MRGKKILVVEDSKFFRELLLRGLSEVLEIEILAAETRAEAVDILSREKENLFLALCDVTLPDAAHGEVIDDVLDCSIPVIVFTANFDPAIRDQMTEKGVVDYVPKDTPSSLDYVMWLTQRLARNLGSKVLVVDDSSPVRKIAARNLRSYMFDVVEAKDGHEALDLVLADDDIRLVVSDHQMPNMSGFELTKALRRKYSKNDLVIIGMSDTSNRLLAVEFLKYGANDFVSKPFLPEEFALRITQNLEMVEQVAALNYAAFNDFLTDMYNRRYLFGQGQAVYDKAVSDDGGIGVAVFDIDHFKKINDSFGHDAGDEVLKAVAAMIKGFFPAPSIASRIGGEEFCVLAVDMDKKQMLGYLEDLRAEIEATPVETSDGLVDLSMSFGVDWCAHASLDAAVAHVDGFLYQAKEGGRNRVVAGPAMGY